jgi:hypothetical protein
MVAMSDEEVKARLQFTIEQRRFERKFANYKHPAYELQTGKLKPPVRPSTIEADPMLSIQVRQSTIQQIREISWEVSKRGNDYTYDELLRFMVESFMNSVRT